MRITSVAALGDGQDRTRTPPVAVAFGDQERRNGRWICCQARPATGGQRWKRAASGEPRARIAAADDDEAAAGGGGNVWGDGQRDGERKRSGSSRRKRKRNKPSSHSRPPRLFLRISSCAPRSAAAGSRHGRHDNPIIFGR
jgi:hypothetical protein